MRAWLGGTGALAQVLVLPMMLAILLFYCGPILFGVWASLQREGAAMTGGDLIGLAHYASLVRDPRFHESAWITIAFTVSTCAATYGCGLAVALLLRKRFAGRAFVSSGLLIPWTMPLVVVAVVWGWLLDYQFGAVNYLLRQAGLIDRSIGFLTDPDIALWSVGLAQVWRLTPLAMVMLLAALKAIPADLYEAADIDGASRWQAFRHVTLPGIRSTTSALVLLLTIWAFGRAFTILFIMTGGGPAGATETLVVQTYLEAFRNFRLERASALGTIVLVASFVLTLFYLRVRHDR